MVILDKSGAKTKISLDKKTIAVRDIRISLRWSSGQAAKPRGFWSSLFGGGESAKDIDLDLGVFVKCADGAATIIDPVQSSFQAGDKGSLSRAPWCLHSGDDRAGGGGELVQVSGSNLAKVSKIIVYTFIYDGAAAWSKTDATVLIEAPGCDAVTVKMGEQSDSRKFCALASLSVTNGEQIEVERLMTFHAGHEDCDRRYSWGFQWTAGSK